MQRLLSLATLIFVMGGGWMFLTGQNPRGNSAGGPDNRQPPQGYAPFAAGGMPQGPAGSPNVAPPPGAAANYPPAGGYARPPATPGQLASTGAEAGPSKLPSQASAGGAVGGYAGAPAIRAGAGQPLGAPPPSNPQGPLIRIASFNIQVFGTTKASKPYVMETLAAIVRNFDIVAIQEIRTKDDYLLNRFLEYVNAGGRQSYDSIIGPRLGNTTSKEQYAFVFDTTRIELGRHHVYTVRDPDNLLHREPLVAMFRTRVANPQEAFTFILANIHTDPDVTDIELDALAQVYRAVRTAAGGEDDIILLGDLNVDDQHLGDLGRIPGVRPVVSGVFTNTRQNKLYDNLILHGPSTTEFTGRWGVYDVQRLHNLNMEQALMVSDHLPVWAEFSAYESVNPGYRFSGRRPPPR